MLIGIVSEVIMYAYIPVFVTVFFFFFFQAEDGIRDVAVTGVQTCALPISDGWAGSVSAGVVRPESELRFRPDDTGAHTPRPSVRSLDLPVAAQRDARPHRSEERRVGKECRARRRPDA